MAGFAKGMWTVLFGEVVAAAAVLAWSPKARDAARPYLVRAIRSALDIGDDVTRMVEEAKREAGDILAEVQSGDGLRTGSERRTGEYTGARGGH
jgi:hypothetical protein